MTLLETLKKRTRSHKFQSLMSRQEIEKVLEIHVPRLHSIQVLKSGISKLKGLEYYVLVDEYMHEEALVIQSAKDNLKKEFLKKFPKNVDRQAVKECLNNM